MTTVRIWTLESENDSRAVRRLAEKLLSHLGLSNISIRTAWKRTTNRDALMKRTQHYLMQDDCVIFVIDRDGLMSRNKQQQEPNSWINQIKWVRKEIGVTDRVFFAPAVEELEAWLLIDCIGIFCYFASKHGHHKENCRENVKNNQSFQQLVKRYQKINTEKIVDTGTGNSGAKRLLTEFSEKILIRLNPNIKAEATRYHPAMSPKLAEHVVIDGQTIQRNNSLRYLGSVLARFNCGD